MANNYVKDMTKGHIAGHLVTFALPMLAGNIFQQLYNMVDSIIVGRYVGSNALGAVGSVGSLCFLFFSLCMGLASGIGILVSQFFGAGEEKKVKSCIGQAIYVTLAAGILMSLLGALFARPILVLMKTPPEAFQDALIYMRIVCGCTFIVAVYNSISAILRALGDSKTPLYFLIVASIINIIGDLVLVVAFHMGVAGVAIATAIAQLISAVGSALWGMKKNPYLKIDIENLKPDREIITREVAMGLPLAAQSATIAISCVALQSVVNRFGSTVMASYTASNRIEQLVQQPLNSLGIALSTFAGQNYGAKQPKRIHRAAFDGLIMIAAFSLLMVVVMHVFGENIVGIFIKDADVIEIGARGIKFTSLMYFFLGLIYVMRGLLNGVGDVTFSMMNGICEVICRIGFAVLLIFAFKMDYMAVWYTNGLTWGLTGLLSVFRFYQGKWKRTLELQLATE